MKKYHFLIMAVLIFAVYLAGVKYPAAGKAILGKVGIAS